MELWTCTIDDCDNAPVLLGIFSSKEKAKEQAQLFMDEGEPFELVKVIDEGESDEALCYDTLHTKKRYIAYIEKHYLDEFSK